MEQRKVMSSPAIEPVAIPTELSRR
jgi:hypothetical protein